MKSLWPLLVLLPLFLLTRLYALSTLPIFLDETVHLRWAFNISQGDKLLRPWADGRLLTIWLYAFILPHVKDFLVVGRALSGVAGAVTLVGLVAIGRRLGSPLGGAIAASLYVFCPFALFYDRLALTDSFLSAGATLTLLLCLALVEKPTRARAGLLGLVLFLCVLIKFSGILLFLLPVSCGILLSRRPEVLRAFLGASALALLLLLYPFFLFVGTDMLKIVTVQAREAGLWTDTLANLGLAARYLVYYWGLGLLVLGALGAVLMAGRPEGRLLIVLTLLPILVVAVTLRVWFARYILWETVPFLLLAGLGLARLWEARGRSVALCLLLLAILPVLARDRNLIVDPPAAGLPPAEESQYVNGWPSGYGVRETVLFLEEALRREPAGITVVTHSASHRTLWNAFDLFFQDEPRFRNEDLDLSDPDAVPWLVRRGVAGTGPTYVVLAPRSEGAHKTTVSRDALERIGSRVAVFRQPDGVVASEIYLVNAPGPG